MELLTNENGFTEMPMIDGDHEKWETADSEIEDLLRQFQTRYIRYMLNGLPRDNPEWPERCQEYLDDSVQYGLRRLSDYQKVFEDDIAEHGLEKAARRFGSDCFTEAEQLEDYIKSTPN